MFRFARTRFLLSKRRWSEDKNTRCLVIITLWKKMGLTFVLSKHSFSAKFLVLFCFVLILFVLICFILILNPQLNFVSKQVENTWASNLWSHSSRIFEPLCSQRRVCVRMLAWFRGRTLWRINIEMPGRFLSEWRRMYSKVQRLRMLLSQRLYRHKLRNLWAFFFLSFFWESNLFWKWIFVLKIIHPILVKIVEGGSRGSTPAFTIS